MKTIITIIFLLSFSLGNAQNVVFQDDFESGTSNWLLTNQWGLNSSSSHSSSNSLTESPSGNYTDNETSFATLQNGVDLSQALSANLSFWTKYSIEAGFDYMYLEVSPNGGTTWIQMDSYDGLQGTWVQKTYSLGGYVGNPNVKIRFKFESDGAVNEDGMYIDDLIITSDTVDNADPLILYTAPVFYQSSLSAFNANVDILDISGVQTALCFFSVDGSSYDSVSYNSQSNNTFSFTIPQQEPGAMIEFYFKAVDSSANANSAVSNNYKIIQGNYIHYDNGVVDFVDSTGTNGARAVRMTLPGPVQITSLLIRNYTDINRPNDSMLVHVWADNNGVPGVDLITPFKVYPTANLQQTSPMTVVDLRADSVSLSGLTGDVFVGFSVPSGGVWSTITQPGPAARSFVFDGTTWSAAQGTSGNSDFHFRIVTSNIIGLPTADFSIDTTASPTITFNNLSTDAITYKWNFGDFTPTDTAANPSHTYAVNGNYNVCLIAFNSVGSDTMCKPVSISNIPAPVSSFTYDDSLSPIIQFYDQSSNNPISWLWVFDHNGAQSGLQNPSYTYPASSATYNVCLTASSLNGTGNTYCEDIIILDDTGIEDVGNEFVTISPNPFTDKSKIKIELIDLDDVLFNVYDINGKRININYNVGLDGIEIYRSELEAGNYIFELYVKGKKYSGRIIAL
jgi:PKD repeat protein